MMKLILFRLLASAILISAPAADAQQPGKVFRIGYLDCSTASGSAVLTEAFRQELLKLGWIEGKNFTIEYRVGEFKGADRMAELAAELVRLKIDLIVVTGAPGALAAKGATTTIPIVMASVGDPVGIGLVASLARPGGNVTGNSSLGELSSKRLEILKDAVPKLARVGFLRGTGGSADLLRKELRPAALALKLKLEEIETEVGAKVLESAFQTAKQKQVGAIMTAISRNFSPKESASSSLPANTGCRLFTHRRSLSMTAVSCPTGLTPLICTSAPPTT